MIDFATIIHLQQHQPQNCHSTRVQHALEFNEHQQLQLPHPDHPEDGHTDVVYKVHLQGDHLVSVSADQTARIWDLKTQHSLHPPLVGHTGSVLVVQFDAAADNNVIITGDTSGNIIVWRFSTGELVNNIAGAHQGSVLSLHFDHRYLVTGGKDGKIKLWNRHPKDINDTDFLQYATRSAGGGRYVAYSLLATFDGHRAAVNALKLRDDILVSGSGDSAIYIWSLQTGEILHKVDIHQRGIACLQFNGRYIISGSTDNTIKIYDIEQKAEVACLEGHSNLVRSVQAISDDSADIETIVSGSYDGSIRIWERDRSSQGWQTQHQFHISGFEAHESEHPDDEGSRFGNRIFSVDLDSNRLVCSGQGPMIRVWDLRLPSTK